MWRGKRDKVATRFKSPCLQPPGAVGRLRLRGERKTGRKQRGKEAATVSWAPAARTEGWREAGPPVGNRPGSERSSHLMAVQNLTTTRTIH